MRPHAAQFRIYMLRWRKLVEHIYRSCDTGETPIFTNESFSLRQLVAIMQEAVMLPGKGPLSTMVMLLALCEKLRRTDRLLLASKTLRESKLNRATVYRALELLEHSGLVKVKRQKGLAPLVTLYPPHDTAAACTREVR